MKINKLKKWIGIMLGLAIATFALQYAVAQTGSKINLNSPVSFPVDI